MEREEYIKKLKVLIKKYHPDLCADESLRPGYTEITIKLNQGLYRLEHGASGEGPDAGGVAGGVMPGGASGDAPAGRAGGGPEAAPDPRGGWGFSGGDGPGAFYFAPFQAAAREKTALRIVRDQGYAWYRQGIKYYQRVHPNRFYRKVYYTTGLAEREPVTRRERFEILKEFFAAFHMAERFFSAVVRDYPGSPWVFDSRRKLRMIEKLRAIYSRWFIRGEGELKARKS
ncbi:MAG: hypothetical protein LBL43_07575 [Treponema sp.]|jgi:hypothetical protein|nr:hypothetical protein [Treponema sp.]